MMPRAVPYIYHIFKSFKIFIFFLIKYLFQASIHDLTSQSLDSSKFLRAAGNRVAIAGLRSMADVLA